MIGVSVRWGGLCVLCKVLSNAWIFSVIRCIVVLVVVLVLLEFLAWLGSVFVPLPRR